ncbi:NADH-quinone oxidoreductase subunit N [Halomicrobium salinisoli]|uniref:NADH-quinone oxidoreductase subunit N n=1 Tax=Halomicrobium salinisoli TaxID=2878391 RepID=UPI001CF06E9C|nr:NADH-quinone oxidoreductase subunit N [Halomicrobium salinisoli]
MVQLPTWAALGPSLVLGLTALALFVVDSIDPDSENVGLLAGIAGLGTFTAAGTSVWYLISGTGLPTEQGGRGIVNLFTGQLIVDQMALFIGFIVASVAFLVVLASYDYLEGLAHQAEFYSLVMLAATGMTLLGAANSLATAFIALELASLPSFALVAFLKHNKGSVEAGLKYFLVGALSSGILAYGISLVYAATGSLQFAAVAEGIGDAPASVLGVGIMMVIGGVAYKTSSVPFHYWAPEAYEGAPAPISAFLSSASKAAAFVLGFRVFVTAFPIGEVAGTIDWVLVFQVLAVATMTLGNFAAATQERVKRMLAYSSIGHAGYVLIGLAALTSGADHSSVLGAGMAHLLVYGFMNTGAFLFIALAEYWDVGRTFEDYNGLGSEAPLACAAMTVFLFSLAGLPIGGGFWSKFYLLMATVNSGTWILGAALIVNSALSLFYYSRVVKALWIEDPTDGGFDIDHYPVGLYTAIVSAAVVTFALLFGFGGVSAVAESAAGLLL